jgi:putative tryptophan/tyrosine transport system substrate-binding protein
VTARTRRRFLRAGLALAGLGLAAGCGVPSPGISRPSKVHRIGVLHLGAGPFPPLAAFRAGLGRLGYEEGRDFVIEARSSPARRDMVGLAAELAALPVDVILAAGPGTAFPARDSARTIPVVFAEEPDPVGSPSYPGQRLVVSQARPGGTITGLSSAAGDLAAKRVEILKDAVPSVSRALVRALVLTSAEPSSHRHIVVAETAIVARRLGLDTAALVARAPGDLPTVLAQGASRAGGGLIVVGDGLIRDSLSDVVALAAQHKLPAIYEDRTFAEAGGLLAYGPNLDTLYRRAAEYVDKILKGADPAEMPVEKPTRLDFIVNRRAEQALGLSVSKTALLQATEIIQ